MNPNGASSLNGNGGGISLGGGNTSSLNVAGNNVNQGTGQGIGSPLNTSSLNVAGNNYNPNSPVSSLQNQVANNQTSINSANTQASALQQQILALEQSIANKPVAPTLDLNSLNSQAQAQANNTVNPLYTQYLNQYLQEESANQQAAQNQNTLNLQQEQSALGNTLAQNQQAQLYAGQQNAGTQANINAQATNYQLNSGNAQNQKMQVLQQGIGSGNLAASGYGQQQLYEAENAKNIADAQQQGQFQYQRDTGNLSTQDTFAQLAQSSQYATTAEGQQEAQTNFNLNDYLRQAAYNDSQYRQQLSASQQQAVTATTQQNEANLIQQQLQQYQGNGGVYAAGESAYGNLLSPSLSLPSAPSQSDYLNAYGNAV